MFFLDLVFVYHLREFYQEICITVLSINNDDFMTIPNYLSIRIITVMAVEKRSLNITDCITVSIISLVTFLLLDGFGWAVWHSCRMGDQNQEQTRGRIGSQLRLGNLRVGELLFQIRLHALYSTRPHGLVQAIFCHMCPDLDLGP